MENKEIECRFLEIDKEALIKKLLELGAKDKGEELLEETIIYDQELKWRDINKRLRIRKDGGKIFLTFKETKEHTVDGTDEIELEINDYEKAELLFERIGLRPYRHQQKKRHTFLLNGVICDIDTWPRIPPFVELEGNSEEELKATAKLLGYDWKDVVFHNPKWVIENVYNIPVGTLSWFTFDRYE